ncbi:CbtB domain-containing protein [Seohaeicola saemankumensis]|jgi:cobalt transporter subunit CbtB|uniref:CbtB domain-containing protein n=1 Tax=Seohaeicola TaxID=481178 RepID=UPI0035CEABFE
MTTLTKTLPATSKSANLASQLTAIALGLALLFVGGFAGAEVLHNSAHDTRHATGFPCH